MTTSTLQIGEISRKEGDVKQDDRSIKEYQQQTTALKLKCGRSEAQGILVSVQQLDLLARGIAVTLSVGCLYYYWSLVWWCFVHDWPSAKQLYENVAPVKVSARLSCFSGEPFVDGETDWSCRVARASGSGCHNYP